MHTEVIDGRRLAREVTDKVAAEAATLPRRPGLAVIIVGDDPASHLYVRNKVRTAERVGFNSETVRLDADTSEADVLARINWLNSRDDIDGILVQLPLPPQMNTLRVMATVDPRKDVDGLHALNAGKLTQGSQALIPCTPMGCLKIIKSVIPDLTGCHAVVIGASNIVGKPMAALLTAKSATVTLAHSRTRDLAAHVARAEILVAAVGVPHLVKGEWVRPGACVIDVGMNRITTAEGKSRLTGDVDYEGALGRAGWITPVPGGVGPMTIACLLANTLKAARARSAPSSPSPAR